MSLKFGDLNIGSMYFGERKIAEGWLGDIKVFGSGSPAPSSTVKIGGRDYPFVQIGNQLWITENLDWKFDGLTFRDGVDGNEMDDTSLEQACYYSYDESTYGVTGNKYGLLYNGSAVRYLNSANILPTGWRIPSTSDFNELITFVGENPGRKLKSTSWNGTDDYGFNAKPYGFWAHDFAFLDIEGRIFGSTYIEVSDALEALYFSSSASVEINGSKSWTCYPIRLCCSAS